jgi:hypothetical protein
VRTSIPTFLSLRFWFTGGSASAAFVYISGRPVQAANLFFHT